MPIANFVRGLDRFGSGVSFNIAGESHKKTLGGGLVSLFISVLVLWFFVKQLSEVVQTQDPQISSYMIAEDRLQMEEPLDLAEYNTNFYFFFMDKKDAPVVFDSRYGSFQLSNFIGYVNADDGSFIKDEEIL